MTLQDFTEKNGIVGVIRSKIPNKTMKKYLNSFKYIDVIEYWYNDPDKPDYYTWIDIEGIGYGWIWLNYEKSEKLMRKAIIKFAMRLYRESKNEMHIRTDNGISYVLLEDKDGKCIIQIRTSNKELHW